MIVILLLAGEPTAQALRGRAKSSQISRTRAAVTTALMFETEGKEHDQKGGKWGPGTFHLIKNSTPQFEIGGAVATTSKTSKQRKGTKKEAQRKKPDEAVICEPEIRVKDQQL